MAGRGTAGPSVRNGPGCGDVRPRSFDRIGKGEGVMVSSLSSLGRNCGRCPPAGPVVSLATESTYDLEEQLGSGGMGVVYRAIHVKLGRSVALKMMHPGLFTADDAKERFFGEVKALAMLDHPDIVRIEDYGQDADGVPFYCMELVEGETLAERLRRQSLPLAEALALLERLARAIDHAHQAGIVHRDLKPSNILIGYDGSLKIADFGVAKYLNIDGPTRPGTVLGTEGYMAPEQAAGLSHLAEPTADIYSLGAILYRLLTGRLPEWRPSPHGRKLVPPRSFQPGVPAAVDAICRRCLRRRPRDRFPSAQALADALVVVRGGRS